MQTKRDCPNCGESFMASNTREVYCSVECGLIHRRSMRESPAEDHDGEIGPPSRAASANETLDRLVASDHVARYLHVPVEEVERMAGAGDIPGQKAGTKWVFSVRAINRWLRTRADGGVDHVPEDLPPAIEVLVRRVSQLGAEVEAISERLVPILAILPELPAGKMVAEGTEIGFDLKRVVTLDTLEAAYIKYVLHRCGHNKTQAADALGVDPSTLYRKLSKLGWQ